VQKWLQYRQAQKEAQGREQTEPARASAKRTRDIDHSL